MKKLIFFVIIVLYFVVGIVGGENSYKMNRIRVKATGYCPCVVCCGKWSNGLTSTGRDAYLPGIAVDPKVISLGSRIDIPLNEYFNGGSWILADDIGGKIRGNHIDVRFATHEEAKNFGVKYFYIRVWSK